MNEPTKSNTKAGCPPVPQSIMTASRDELDNVELEIEGNLPKDLQGHIFIVDPVGTVESGGLPFKDGDSLLNGDGMIYRLDFDRPTAWLRQISKRQASYKIPVQQDYQELVDQNEPEIRKLFENEVYPHFH